jgi:nucleotide-binding universal stress UspA family protein
MAERGYPRKILVATDLSEPADEAVRQAHQRAERAGAELAVCHVVRDELRANPLFPQLNQLGAMRAPLDRERQLGAVVERVSMLTARSPEGFAVFVEEGIPHAAIVARAEAWGADLVVVGSYGSTGLARVLLGSVAQKVARHAHGAVLVARPHERTAEIVVGTDFSDPALPAVHAAADEARRTGARVTMVHAIEPIAMLPGPMDAGAAAPMGALASGLKELEDLSRNRLAAALEECRIPGEAVLTYGSAAATLVRIAEERRADLMVVGTKGRTGLRRALLGSVAETVLGAAPCSVLVVRLHET